MTEEFFSIAVPVKHYRMDDSVTNETVQFRVSRQDNKFKAIPLISKEERLITGLPERLEFIYISPCIASANDMEEESLDAIKEIILELEVQELLEQKGKK